MAQRLDYEYSTNGHSHHHDSLPDLIRQLAEEAGILVRQEVQLAKVEMTEKAKASSPAMGMFAGAGVLALGAFAALTACFIAALASGMPVWLAALIVTIVYLIAAAVLGYIARERMKTAPSLTPDQTIQSLKEDVAWVKTQGQYGRR